MKQFADIERSFNKVNYYLGQQVAIANKRNDKLETVKWERIQRINDNAYFLLLFAQLEDGISNRASAITSAASYRYSFMNKVKKLTADVHILSKISYYYAFRNSAAHGSMVPGLVMISVINDLKTLARALQI